MEEYNDIELVKKSKSGDFLALEELIKRYESKVYNIVYQHLKNEQDAKDIAQEVFISIYKNLNKFNEKSKFSTWVYRIAVNKSIDELRKRKSKTRSNIVYLDEKLEKNGETFEKQLISDEVTPEKKIIQKEKNSKIKEALDKLKTDHKTIIVLRDIQGLSYEEIAGIMECSQGTVKSRLSRARKKLMSILNDMELKEKELRLNE